MSRISRALLPVSVATALLLSGLQTQAFADSAKSAAPSTAADLQGWRSQSVIKRDGREVKELAARL
jgi:hypothetical protein